MKKLSYLLLCLLFIFFGVQSLRLSAPLFEINQMLTTKKALVDSDVNFDVGGLVVLKVEEDSPASQNGIVRYSQITQINRIPIESTLEFVERVDEQRGRPIVLTICRLNRCEEVEVIPREKHPENQGPLGVNVSDASLYNKSNIKIVYEMLSSAYTGQDIYTVLFGKRALVIRYLALFVSIAFLLASFKMLKKLLRS